MKQMECSLGMNVKQVIALIGSNMYNGNVVDNIVKELAQNSFDAVKIMKLLNPSHESRIWITIDSSKRTIVVKDNGIGMSPEVVKNAFFVIGGSYKGDDVANEAKSGGLGFAKVLFLFSSEGLKVSTVHDGVKTTFETNPKEIEASHEEEGKKIALNVTPTDEPNGTTVEVKIPEYYIDNNGDKNHIWFSSNPPFLGRTMIGDVTVVVNGKESYKGNVDPKYLYIGKAAAAFGELELYITPITRSYISSQILISGLYQFERNDWQNDGEGGLDVIVNILPSVGVQDRLYPINNQRQGFRSTVMPEVRDLDKLLKRIHKAYINGQYAAAFSSCLSMDVRKLSEEKRIPHSGTLLKQAIAMAIGNPVPEEDKTFTPFAITFTEIKKIVGDDDRSSTLDASGVNIPDVPRVDTSSLDINKPVFHNNTSMVIGEDGHKVMKEFGALLLELKDLYVQAWGGNNCSRCSWDVIPLRGRIKNQFWGISLDKGYLGINVNPRMFDFLAVNPFGFALPQQEGIDQSTMLTEFLVHAVIHEVNHIYASGEGETFTSRLIHTEAEFTAIGTLYEQWKKKLYTLVSENLLTFAEYNTRYQEASNASSSLRAE